MRSLRAHCFAFTFLFVATSLHAQIRVDWCLAAKDAIKQTHQVVVLPDGSFASAVFETDARGKRQLIQLIKQQDDTIVESRYGQHVFDPQAGTRSLTTAPGPVQWAMNPWPVLPTIDRWIDEAGDTEVVTTGDITTRRSIKAGWSIDRRHGDVVSVSVGTSLTVRFSDYEDLGWARLPTSMRQIFHAAKDSKTGLSTESLYHRCNAEAASGADIDKVFDPQAWNINRIDKAGNVYDKSGTLLYNFNELERSLTGGLDVWYRQRWFVPVAASVAALVAGGFLWRQYQRRRPRLSGTSA